MKAEDIKKILIAGAGTIFAGRSDPVQRTEHGGDVFRGDVGQDIVDLLENEAPVFSHDIDIFSDMGGDVLR